MPLAGFAESTGLFGATPLENMFIFEYLPKAPDGAVRVFIYLRMLAGHPEMGETCADAARALGISEDELVRWMNYWEQMGLVQRVSDQPISFEFLPINAQGGLTDPLEREYYTYRDFHANLQAHFDAENIVHGKELAMANDWVNIFGLSQEAALRAVELQMKHSRAKKPETVFAALDKLVRGEWARMGIHTPEEVEQALQNGQRRGKLARSVAKRLGIARDLTQDELALAGKWLGEWKLSEDDVLSACQETTKSRNPSFAYLDAILASRMQDDGTYAGLRRVLAELGGAGRLPTPDEQKTYRAWIGQGFEPETVQLAAVQSARGGKRRMEDVGALLDKWRARSLLKYADAESFVRESMQLADEVRALLERAGSDRRVRMSDIEALQGWKRQFAQELIEFAADQSRGKKEPVSYMTALLNRWAERGVEDVEGARREQAAQPSAAQPKFDNPALRYEQRTYRDEDYDGLFVDLDHYTENGGGRT